MIASVRAATATRRLPVLSSFAHEWFFPKPSTRVDIQAIQNVMQHVVTHVVENNMKSTGKTHRLIELVQEDVHGMPSQTMPWSYWISKPPRETWTSPYIDDSIDEALKERILNKKDVETWLATRYKLVVILEAVWEREFGGRDLMEQFEDTEKHLRVTNEELYESLSSVHAHNKVFEAALRKHVALTAYKNDDMRAVSILEDGSRILQTLVMQMSTQVEWNQVAALAPYRFDRGTCDISNHLVSKLWNPRMGPASSQYEKIEAVGRVIALWMDTIALRGIMLPTSPKVITELCAATIHCANIMQVVDGRWWRTEGKTRFCTAIATILLTHKPPFASLSILHKEIIDTLVKEPGFQSGFSPNASKYDKRYFMWSYLYDMARSLNQEGPEATNDVAHEIADDWRNVYTKLLARNWLLLELGTKLKTKEEENDRAKAVKRLWDFPGLMRPQENVFDRPGLTINHYSYIVMAMRALKMKTLHLAIE